MYGDFIHKILQINAHKILENDTTENKNNKLKL